MDGKKLLYSIKICLLEAQISQLPAGTITTAQQVPKVREFVILLLSSTALGGLLVHVPLMPPGMTSICIAGY